MTPTATHNEHDPTPERVLFVAFALREKTWQLGCTTGHGQKPRVRQAVAQATRRCGLPESAPGVSGDAAGRDGCWRHRLLTSHGRTNQGGDSSSIAVNRRQRRAKSDALDVRTLVSLRIRFPHGAGEVWRVGHVPPVAAEDQRPLPRDWDTLKQARASPTTRIKGLRSRQGRRLTRLRTCPDPLDALRLGEGAPVPHGLRQRWLRGWAQHEVLRPQMSRGGGRATCLAGKLAGCQQRAGASVDAPARHWHQWVGVIGAGIVCLARVQASA